MAIERLGDYYAQSGYASINYTLLDGINRLIIVLVGLQDDEENGLSAVTLDGVAIRGAAATGWSADNRLAYVGYWLEEDLPAENGDYTIAFSGNDIDHIGIAVRTYQYVKQQAPEDTDTQQLQLERYPYVTLTTTALAIQVGAFCINDGAPAGITKNEWDTGLGIALAQQYAELCDVYRGAGANTINMGLGNNNYNTQAAGASFAAASDEENHPIKVLQVQLGVPR